MSWARKTILSGGFSVTLKKDRISGATRNCWALAPQPKLCTAHRHQNSITKAMDRPAARGPSRGPYASTRAVTAAAASATKSHQPNVAADRTKDAKKYTTKSTDETVRALR